MARALAAFDALDLQVDGSPLDCTWYVIMDLKITPSGQTIVKPTALGPGANTDTKLLIYGLFQKGRVLAQDGGEMTKSPITLQELRRRIYVKAKAEKSWRFLRQGFGWKRWK